MALPFFYSATINTTDTSFVLNEETSKHVAQVLRMQNGEQIQLTDGRGTVFTAEISDNNKKKATVKLLSSRFQPADINQHTIAISLVKNAHRFEWFLEKATEIGTSAIVPLLCSRTEKQHFRLERMQGILISAMLQSQQSWLPQLQEPIKFAAYLAQIKENTNLKKFIAHCVADEPRTELGSCGPFNDSLVLIGPEGDFTIDEIELALQQSFLPVALGKTRLRTETAGVVAATVLSLDNI